MANRINIQRQVLYNITSDADLSEILNNLIAKKPLETFLLIYT